MKSQDGADDKAWVPKKRGFKETPFDAMEAMEAAAAKTGEGVAIIAQV